MTTKSKIAMLVTLAAIGVASPAFAQSFDPAKERQKRVASRHEGLNALAMAPRAQRGSVSADPANTGGGSLGYNEELKNY